MIKIWKEVSCIMLIQRELYRDRSMAYIHYFIPEESLKGYIRQIFNYGIRQTQISYASSNNDYSVVTLQQIQLTHLWHNSSFIEIDMSVNTCDVVLSKCKCNCMLYREAAVRRKTNDKITRWTPNL